MVGQIGPLVQVGRKKTALALHVLGGVARRRSRSASCSASRACCSARAIGDTLDTVFVVVVPAALIYAASVDLGLLPVRPITWVRQTPGDWPCSMGHYPGIFAWGFDLGLGVTTRIPYQSLLVVPLAAFLVGDLATRRRDHDRLRSGARARRRRRRRRPRTTTFRAVCDAIQDRVLTLKKLVGATALVIAALIVIS